tara:strand:- start:990 stop:1145 length:156 start_codon:yes stop_codon:yes gene_type:complete
MKVCRLKIDSKGRVQIPKTFLDANDIPVGSVANMEIIQTSIDAVRLVFVKD